MYPVTDGTNVVYRKSVPCCNTSVEESWVAVRTASGEVVLNSFLNRWHRQHTDYEAAGGWVAYVRSDSTGERVWRRAPDGTTTRITPSTIRHGSSPWPPRAT